MTWSLVIVLAILAFVGIASVLKAPRGTLEAVGAALILGIAGYAVQGRPAQPAAPKQAYETVSPQARGIVETRLLMTNKGIPPNNRWVILADGLTRNGRYSEAAGILRGAVETDPKNSEAWLAMANALVAHADGAPTPASLYAYRNAAKADPENPGPPFFLGLALLQEGRVVEARGLWADLLERAPGSAPWRAPLAEQLQRIDAFLAAERQAAPDLPAARP